MKFDPHIRREQTKHIAALHAASRAVVKNWDTAPSNDLAGAIRELAALLP